MPWGLDLGWLRRTRFAGQDFGARFIVLAGCSLNPNGRNPEDDQVIADLNRTQLERFTAGDTRCRGLELPEGLMLRYHLSASLFFYLKTGVKDGKIVTFIFASDSPYERQKTLVGDVSTPMFAPQADAHHLDRVERMLYAWVDFIRDDADRNRDFSTFEMNGKQHS